MSRLRIAFAGLALCGVAAWAVASTVDEPPPATFVGTAAVERGALPANTAQRTERTDRAGKREVAPVPAATTGSAARTYGPPGRTRIRPGKSPVDGCDRNYGTKAQCIPSSYPKGVKDRCSWLKEHGFTGIEVVADDDQKLDPDRNRIACG